MKVMRHGEELKSLFWRRAMLYQRSITVEDTTGASNEKKLEGKGRRSSQRTTAVPQKPPPK